MGFRPVFFYDQYFLAYNVLLRINSCRVNTFLHVPIEKRSTERSYTVGSTKVVTIIR